MSQKEQSLAKIPLGVAAAFAQGEAGELPLYLPDESGRGQVLYRQAGAGLAAPDLERLRGSGLSHLLVDTDHLAQCEQALESQLGDLIRDPRLDPRQRAECVQAVGAMVARDIISSDEPAAQTKRASVLVDAVVESILADPIVAANLLRVSAHHQSTASHMFSVSFFGILLGYGVFGSERQLLQEIGLAGMLHDIGKTNIPSGILNKDGQLSSDELRVVQHHPIEAIRLIGEDPTVNSRVRQMILQHHERIDGTGYPLGLTDSEITQGSKILAIVDSFHALIGRRTYRAARKPAEAVRLMRYHLNSQFDAKIFNTWTRVLSRYWNSALETNVPTLEADDVAPGFHHDHKKIKDSVRDRQAERLSCQGKVGVQCHYAGRLERVSEAMDEANLPLHDLSRAGLCMVATYPMYRGEIVHLRVASSDKQAWVRAMVRWCRRDSQRGRFLVGTQFLHRISPDEATDKTPVAGMDDQRLFPELVFNI